MDPFDPLPPKPAPEPASSSPPAPPAPPQPELIKSAASASPASGLTPMMEFFQRRVETLERELDSERERARAAQNLLTQQEALRGEVETQLKSIGEQLKREKTERESQEARSHARGRIEALEKRLDEMTSTFAQLLKEAVAQRDASPAARTAGAEPAAELAAFRGALKNAADEVSRWREDLRGISAVVPQIRSLSERLPEDEKIFQEGVGRRLDEFAAKIARALDEWKRDQDGARALADEHTQAVARERVELARLWEIQSRTLREEQAKELQARETAISRQVEGLALRLEELTGAAKGSEAVRQAVERVHALLAATPKAKDAVIADLEAERTALIAELRDRQEALRRFAHERRDVEKSLSESLMRMTADLESERARTVAAEGRGAELRGEVESLKARVADREQAVNARDARLQALCEERDMLAASLAAEADKFLRAFEGHRAAATAAEQSVAELRQRLEEETSRRAAAEGAAADARAQMGALAQQTARSLQERDATLARYADWEKERQRLLDAIRKKDEMVSLLSSTFQGVMKKGG